MIFSHHCLVQNQPLVSTLMKYYCGIFFASLQNATIKLVQCICRFCVHVLKHLGTVGTFGSTNTGLFGTQNKPAFGTTFGTGAGSTNLFGNTTGTGLFANPTAGFGNTGSTFGQTSALGTFGQSSKVVNLRYTL